MENKKLTKEQYFEWRFIISEMQLSEEKFRSSSYQVEILNKDAEITRLNAKVAKQNLTTYKEKVDLAKKDYFQFKEKLEQTLDISLNNKVIDDITLEIKELE